MSLLVRTLGPCTLFIVLVFYLWNGIHKVLDISFRVMLGRVPFSVEDGQASIEDAGLPDFSQYVPLKTISEQELDLEHRRLIIVGDIHGMKRPMDKLLATLSFSSSDLLVHLGDTIAKGPDTSSLLQQFADANTTGVRGNHEQKVIEWRGWIEWIESQKGGKEWLHDMERSKSYGIDVWKRYHKLKEGNFSIPKGWKFMGEHYRIARSLTVSQYTYLRDLPLVIHLPSLHTHLVHAGILPFDPKFPPISSGQPLAHVPDILAPLPTGRMRAAQERALLTDINPNTDPWVLLNMRSVLDNNRVSRNSKAGTPWSDLWNMIMNRCGGYHQDSDASPVASRLPCMPISVVYGHTASRGLDIKRWSFGLDTGCVYGRNLTAMIVTDANNLIDIRGTQNHEVLFGDNGSIQLISIPCA